MRLHLRQASNFAIYYGFGALDQLESYEVVVLHPGAHSKADIQRLKDHNTIPLAYLSLGEDGESKNSSSQDIQSWWKPSQDGAIQQNPEFGSYIVDPAHPEWQKRVLENAKTSLELGFRGFFLDTLDSSDEADQLASRLGKTRIRPDVKRICFFKFSERNRHVRRSGKRKPHPTAFIAIA